MSVDSVQVNAEEAIYRLARVIRDDAPVLLVGAGLSQIVGYDGWNELLEKLKNRFPSPRYPKEIPVPRGPADLMAQSIFDEASDVDQGKWHETLAELFVPCYSEAQLETHCRLLQLPFSGVLTTNYDRVLEDACKVLITSESHSQHAENDPKMPSPETEVINLPVPDSGINLRRFLQRICSPSSRLGKLNSILHIHGFYQDPESIILRQNDYRRHYGKILKRDGSPQENTSFYQTLMSVFTNKPVVCFGFSMTDPFVKRMNGIVNECFGGVEQESPFHWVVLNSNGYNSDEIQKRDLLNSGVCPVFYNVKDTSSAESFKEGLHEMLTNIESICGVPEETEIQRTDGEGVQSSLAVNHEIVAEQEASESVNNLSNRTMLW